MVKDGTYLQQRTLTAINLSFDLTNHYIRALDRLSNQGSVSANITDPQYVPNYSSHCTPHSPDTTAPAGRVTQIISRPPSLARPYNY